MPSANRSEVWLVDLGYVAKVRPCLALSILPNDSERAIVTLVVHTTSSRNSRFEVPSQVSFLKTGVFDAQNLVTIPTAKLLRRLGKLPADQMVAVENAVQSWLGFRELAS
jgi:mRNA interferase MazF